MQRSARGTDTAKIARFYNENAQIEHERLQVFKLEYQISLHFILEALKELEERLPGQTSCSILDIGGGTGRYGECSTNNHDLHPYIVVAPKKHYLTTNERMMGEKTFIKHNC